MQKALREIGFDQYYQAEQAGWILYLEGSTDLAILQAFAERLGNERAIRALERPFVHYVANQPRAAARHYYGLREALPISRAWPFSTGLTPNPTTAVRSNTCFGSGVRLKTTCARRRRSKTTPAQPLPLPSRCRCLPKKKLPGG